MSELSDPEGAFRAAGQLIAAIAEGVPLESVSSRGVVLKASASRSPVSSRRDALGEIAIGLAGVAAVERYRFGTPPPEEGQHAVCLHWAFKAQQLADFAIVRGLIATIDAGDEEDILLRAWQQAESLIHDEAAWEAIEFFAPLIDAFARMNSNPNYQTLLQNEAKAEIRDRCSVPDEIKID